MQIALRRVISLAAVGIIILICAHWTLPYFRDCVLGFHNEYVPDPCGTFLWNVVPWSLGVFFLAYAAWDFVGRPRD